MEQVVPGARAASRRRADLTGTPVFWLTIAVTFCALVPFAMFPRMRGWLGCAVLLMWTSFFVANAIRSRRTHSIISAPVYLAAAVLLGGNTLGLIAVDVWMVWVLGAGIIAANLSERFVGRYL
jgi:apolipoprotein N-acyltransferase